MSIMDIFKGSRYGDRYGSYGRNREVLDPTSSGQVTSAISLAVVAAVQEAIKSAGGSVVVIGHLDIKVQVNAASGGGATVTVTN